MRLQTKHVDALIRDVQALKDFGCVNLIRAARAWSDCVQKGYDQDTVAYHRRKFEKELYDFRITIGEIYDEMGERGMLAREEVTQMSEPTVRITAKVIKVVGPCLQPREVPMNFDDRNQAVYDSIDWEKVQKALQDQLPQAYYAQIED